MGVPLLFMGRVLSLGFAISAPKGGATRGATARVAKIGRKKNALLPAGTHAGADRPRWPQAGQVQKLVAVSTPLPLSVWHAAARVRI
jgi:hypothetical protein